MAQTRGQQKFFAKDKLVNILEFVDHTILVTTIQLCHCSMNASWTIHIWIKWMVKDRFGPWSITTVYWTLVEIMLGLGKWAGNRMVFDGHYNAISLPGVNSVWVWTGPLCLTGTLGTMHPQKHIRNSSTKSFILITLSHYCTVKHLERELRLYFPSN